MFLSLNDIILQLDVSHCIDDSVSRKYGKHERKVHLQLPIVKKWVNYKRKPNILSKFQLQQYLQTITNKNTTFKFNSVITPSIFFFKLHCHTVAKNTILQFVSNSTSQIFPFNIIIWYNEFNSLVIFTIGSIFSFKLNYRI